MKGVSEEGTLKRVRPASLRELVADNIRHAILEGRLQPGQKLVEKDLCLSLGISRSLLREALPQLQAEGLIKSITHKGPSVAQIDAEEVKQIYQIRRVLEALAASEFARHATEEQIKDLRRQLVSLKHLASGNLRDLLIAKAGFYSVLFAGCGNRMLGQTIMQLNNRIALCKSLSLRVAGRPREAIDELEGVVSAIEDGDAKRAGRLCEIHVENAEKTVLRALAEEAGAAPPPPKTKRKAQ
jgi:DNA-binding GntR family transcriptional regulator